MCCRSRHAFFAQVLQNYVADQSCTKLTLDVLSLETCVLFCTGATQSIAKPITGSYEQSVVANQGCTKLTLDVLSLETCDFCTGA